MAIPRQKIASSISPGNFGVAGTPLPKGQGPKIPNLAGLAESLGVVTENIAGEKSKENVQLATTAIQEALIETKGKGRDEQMHAVEAVREQFEDQGAFLEAFTNENKAVQAIDNINGRAKANQTRATVEAFIRANPDMDLEQKQAGILKVIQDESGLLKSVSDKTHQAYTDQIFKYALEADDRITAESVERNKARNLLSVMNTNVAEADTALTSLAGVFPDEMNSDLVSFQTGQENLDKSGMAFNDAILNGVKDVYSKSFDLSGDRDRAGQQAVSYLAQVAEKYNRPEIMDAAREDLFGRGEPLSKFYGEQINEIQAQIEDKKVRREAHLRSKADSQSRKKWNADYSAEHQRLTADIADANANPLDYVKSAAVADDIQNRLDRINTEVDQGLWDGRLEQADKLTNLYATTAAAVRQAHGIEQYNNSMFMAIATETLTPAQYRLWAPHVDQTTKADGFDFIKPQLEASEAMRVSGRQLEAEYKRTTAFAPMVALQNDIVFKDSDPLTAAYLKAIEQQPDKRKLFPQYDFKTFSKQTANLYKAEQVRVWKEEKRHATAEELKAAVQPMVDKVQKMRERREELIKEWSPEIQQREEDKALKAVEGNEAIKKIYRGEDISVKDTESEDGETTSSDLKQIAQLREEGKLSLLDPAMQMKVHKAVLKAEHPYIERALEPSISTRTDLNATDVTGIYSFLQNPENREKISVTERFKALSTAMVSDVVNKKMTVAGAVRLVRDKVGNFDDKNAEHRKLLGDILASGFHFNTPSAHSTYPKMQTPLGDMSVYQNAILGAWQWFEADFDRYFPSFGDTLKTYSNNGKLFTRKGLDELKKLYPGAVENGTYGFE